MITAFTSRLKPGEQLAGAEPATTLESPRPSFCSGNWYDRMRMQERADRPDVQCDTRRLIRAQDYIERKAVEAKAWQIRLFMLAFLALTVGGILIHYVSE